MSHHDALLRVKPELRPRRTGPGLAQVSVGGNIFGVARLIEDASGAVWTALTLLDGTRRNHEVAAQLAADLDVDVDDALGLIAQIHGAGLVEPVEDPWLEELPDGFAHRHEGVASLMAWTDATARSGRWEAPARLHRSHVLVVGMGGTGTHAALGLAAAGVGRLTVVDDDEVADDNLGRQVLYSRADVGRAKVEAAADALEGRFPHLEVEPVRTRLEGPGDFARLLGDVDCLVLGADEPQKIRSWANQACREAGVPWAAGGYQGPQTSTWLFRPGAGPCFDCLELQQAETVEQLGVRVDLDHWSASGVNAVSYVTAAVSGAHLANAALSLLVGVPAIQPNCQYFTSLVRPEHSFVIGLRSESAACPACDGAA
jgi:molybdopterin/thiamine biosynthesis adenylyltransferase